jgi:phenylalanyl-tRNA synthetase alpha chain
VGSGAAKTIRVYALREQLQELRTEYLDKLSQVGDLDQLEALRVELLGRKGTLTSLMKQLGGVAPEDRPATGKFANEVKNELDVALSEAKDRLSKEDSIAGPEVDVHASRPKTPSRAGSSHHSNHVGNLRGVRANGLFRRRRAGNRTGLL